MMIALLWSPLVFVLCQLLGGKHSGVARPHFPVKSHRFHFSVLPRQRRKTRCCGKSASTRVTCSPSLTTCCTSWTPRSCASSRRSPPPRTSWTGCLRSPESKVRRPARRCWTRSTATSPTFCRKRRRDARAGGRRREGLRIFSPRKSGTVQIEHNCEPSLTLCTWL